MTPFSIEICYDCSTGIRTFGDDASRPESVEQGQTRAICIDISGITSESSYQYACKPISGAHLNKLVKTAEMVPNKWTVHQKNASRQPIRTAHESSRPPTASTLSIFSNPPKMGQRI
mmetsp:Transcript_7074/g.11620  ORF Transcript_7074/g.11620 Transcript_7074/m.11620 type:complete len:117 (+) Transcript_7074:44-394(+)